ARLYALPGWGILVIGCGEKTTIARTPPILHGPYYSWTRKINGKTVTRTLTPDQTRSYQPWFDDARQLRTLAAELAALSLTLTEHAEAWGEK
ncbi:MAG: hypothetical protein QOJ63_3806, partial [Solirubrobacteraceae bacterium]|nr:hypothetical protein [Solirubrobacteraceae bacterium]